MLPRKIDSIAGQRGKIGLAKIAFAASPPPVAAGGDDSNDSTRKGVKMEGVAWPRLFDWATLVIQLGHSTNRQISKKVAFPQENHFANIIGIRLNRLAYPCDTPKLENTGLAYPMDTTPLVLAYPPDTEM